jgi:PAS domain S-box-containing protein
MFIFDIIIGMLILSGISMACLGLYARRFSKRIPAAIPYTLLMFSASAWALLYAFEILTSSLQLKILFHNLRFLILPFIAVLELWLVLAFVKKPEWLRKDWAAAVLIIPVAAAILGITSPLHSLFRYNFSIDSSGPVTLLQYTDSPFFSLYILYSLVLLIIAMAILIVESRKRGTLWEEQTILLLVALAFPTVVNYLFVFKITPIPGVNMTAPLLWIAAILYTVALFRYRFLDIIPIARSRLIEIMSTPMLVLDMGGRIIDINPAACSLFLTMPSLAVGKAVHEIVPDWPAFLSLCQSDGTSNAELTLYQEGGVRFYTGSVELILTPSGEPEGRLVFLQDVTEQKRAEDLLREEQQFSTLIVDNLPGIFYLYTYPEHQLIRWNKQHETLLGYTAEEMKDRFSMDWHQTKVKDAVQKAIETVMEKGESSVESTLLAKDGHTIPFFLTGVRFEAQGRLYYMGIGTDITKRKRDEEQREHLIHELEQKNTELDRFTHTISHDLKSPLITIRGFLGLLEEDIQNADPEQAQKDLNRISSAAEKMERLITTLLELSRSGRSVDTPVRIPFTDLAREAAGLLDISLRKYGVTLMIPDALPIISGDRQRLLQVMTNLIDNAAKFMGDQKEPRVEVGFRSDSDTPLFFVKDNGMGIKKENLEKVFGLFERFNPDVPGSGIGLATVKRIIEAHGGKIWVESEGEGKGTTFQFTLPSAMKGEKTDESDTAKGV